MSKPLTLGQAVKQAVTSPKVRSAKRQRIFEIQAPNGKVYEVAWHKDGDPGDADYAAMIEAVKGRWSQDVDAGYKASTGDRFIPEGGSAGVKGMGKPVPAKKRTTKSVGTAFGEAMSGDQGRSLGTPKKEPESKPTGPLSSRSSFRAGLPDPAPEGSSIKGRGNTTPATTIYGIHGPKQVPQQPDQQRGVNPNLGLDDVVRGLMKPQEGIRVSIEEMDARELAKAPTLDLIKELALGPKSRKTGGTARYRAVIDELQGRATDAGVDIGGKLGPVGEFVGGHGAGLLSGIALGPAESASTYGKLSAGGESDVRDKLVTVGSNPLTWWLSGVAGNALGKAAGNQIAKFKGSQITPPVPKTGTKPKFTEPPAMPDLKVVPGGKATEPTPTPSQLLGPEQRRIIYSRADESLMAEYPQVKAAADQGDPLAVEALAVIEERLRRSNRAPTQAWVSQTLDGASPLPAQGAQTGTANVANVATKPKRPLSELTLDDLEKMREETRAWERGGGGDPKVILGPERYKGWKAADEAGTQQQFLTPEEFDAIYMQAGPHGYAMDELDKFINDVSLVESAATPREMGFWLRNKLMRPDENADVIQYAVNKINREGWNPEEVINAAEEAFGVINPGLAQDAADIFAKIRANAKPADVPQSTPSLPAATGSVLDEVLPDANRAKEATRTSAEGHTFTEARVPPESIGVYPGLQYKRVGIVDDANQVTGELLGVSKYDQATAGPLTVWQTLDGKLYAMNGHHRRELAIRTGEPDVPVRIFREADGVDFDKARGLGALQNIRDGKGTALDAVTVLRTMNATPEMLKGWGLSSRGVARDATDMMNLSEESLQYIRDVGVPDGVAAAIGEAKLGPREMATLKEAMRAGLETRSQARFLAERARTAPMVDKSGGMGDLFGDIEESLALGEQAKIHDAVTRRLSSDKRLFNAAVRAKAVGKTRIDNAAQSEAATLQEYASSVIASDPETMAILERMAVEYAQTPTPAKLNEAVDAIADSARRAAERRLNELDPKRSGQTVSDGDGGRAASRPTQPEPEADAPARAVETPETAGAVVEPRPLTDAERAELAELQQRTVARQGPEKGYKPYPMTAKERARHSELHELDQAYKRATADARLATMLSPEDVDAVKADLGLRAANSGPDRIRYERARDLYSHAATGSDEESLNAFMRQWQAARTGKYDNIMDLLDDLDQAVEPPAQTVTPDAPMADVPPPSTPKPDASKAPRDAATVRAELEAIKAKQRLKGGLKPPNKRRGMAYIPDAEDWANAAKAAQLHVELGVRTFAEFSKRMIDDLGDWVKPKLKELWESARFDLKPEGKPIPGKKGPFRTALGAIDTIFSAMREGVATGDISFPTIQGAAALLTDTKAWGKGYKAAFKGYSNLGYEDVVKGIKADPDFDEIVRTGVQLPAITGEVEEQFQNSVLQKVPLGVGRTVKGAQQSYDASATMTRFMMVKSHLQLAKELNGGKPLGDAAMKQIGDAVNSLTGRASSDFGKAVRAADFGRGIFAPSYWVSVYEAMYRPFTTAIDVGRETGDWGPAKLYTRKMARLYAMSAALLYSTKLAVEANTDYKVEIYDPRSKLWGKAYKIKNGQVVAWDILPPQIGQPVRMITSLLFGSKDLAGDVDTSGWGRAARIGSTFEGKSAPGPKMFFNIVDSVNVTNEANAKGKTPDKEDYPFGKNMDPRQAEGWKNMGIASTPITAQSAKEVYETDAMTPLEKLFSIPFIIHSRGPNVYPLTKTMKEKLNRGNQSELSKEVREAIDELRKGTGGGTDKTELQKVLKELRGRP